MARTSAKWPAIATGIWALLFGGLNLSWTFGGRWFTEYLGESIQTDIAENDQQLLIANTIGGLAKIVLGVLALATLSPMVRRVPRLVVSVVLLAAAIGMFLYGFLNWCIATAALVGFIDVPESIGEDPLPWYVWLWEPIWMLGGVLLALTWWAFRNQPTENLS